MTCLTCIIKMKKTVFIATAVATISFCVCSCGTDNTDTSRIRDFISSSWDSTIHFNPEDDGTLIGLPYPYTVPGVGDTFPEMYYWDTYFTNEGLVLDGRVDQARNNTDNMLYLVERFGKMPNGSRTYYLDRSQPPFLSMMVARVYEYTQDKEWLAHAYQVLKKEYEFWMTQRITPVGLNCYSSSASDELIQEFIDTGGRRLGTDFRKKGLSDEELYKLGHDFAAEAESGWDMNPRFDRRCGDFCPVDLNSNLYRYETNFAAFAKILGLDDEIPQWEQAARSRKEKIMSMCWDPEKRQFYDYDYVNGRRSDVVSAAIFSLLYDEVVDREYADCIKAGLKDLEFEYGIAVCEDKPYDYQYQWSYPNSWPPTTYIAIAGLRNYGYDEDARRIARKYLAMVTKSFGQTGHLWEKYNVTDGTTNVSNEYEMPTMLGWSAGTFIYADEFLKGNK